LRAKATKLYPHIYPDNAENSKVKGGTGWRKRIRDPQGVRFLAINARRIHVCCATLEVEPFKKKFQELVEERGLSREHVFNCAESGLYWKLRPNKTSVTSREKEAKAY